MDHNIFQLSLSNLHCYQSCQNKTQAVRSACSPWCWSVIKTDYLKDGLGKVWKPSFQVNKYYIAIVSPNNNDCISSSWRPDHSTRWSLASDIRELWTPKHLYKGVANCFRFIIVHSTRSGCKPMVSWDLGRDSWVKIPARRIAILSGLA